MRSFMMVALSVTFAAMAVSVFGESETPKDDAVADEIKQVLTTQVGLWNAADIPAFMKFYWKSEKLTFSSGGTTRRGWQATLDSYKKKYPTPEKMGQLAFSNLEVDLLGDNVALVLGNWNLKRKQDDDIGGNFSLVFRKIEGQWLIIHDHSSALAKD